MDDMIIPMLQARTGRNKIVKPVNAQRQRNPHGQQIVIALKHDRDPPKCWMGYITIDLLGKDSVDGGKQIASTSALPVRNQDIALSMACAISQYKGTDLLELKILLEI